jgi:hypothetical protein
MISKKTPAVVTLADALTQAQAELARIRDEIAQVKIEIEETERRPVSQVEAEARIDRTISTFADRARRELPYGYFLAPSVGSPEYLRKSNCTPIELLALIAPNQLRATLLAGVGQAAASLPDGIEAADRIKTIAELHARLMELERAEVEQLWAVEDAGMNASWRSDLSPVLVLGLEQAA